MTNEKDKQESMKAEREELQQATQRFVRSMFRTGISLALLPINLLPPEPQQHFYAAGREFTRGVVTLVRELSDGIEEIVKEPDTSTQPGEDPHTLREVEQS